MSKTSFYGRGKILLTGEYGILDGALGLALPTVFGQKMTIKNTTKSDLTWKAYNKTGELWFESRIDLIDFTPIKTTDEKTSETLRKLLKGAVRLNSEFLSKWKGFNVITELEFDKDWGLGSSSTLVHLVANWADIHPLLLYFQVFNGSGYDVACAGADGPITYQLDGDDISYTPVDFDPSFKKNLSFIYLNAKQNSESAVDYFFKKVKNKKALKKELTEITEKILTVKSLSGFIELLQRHESILSNYLSKNSVTEQFRDFDGGVKSLGAWGGDFILAASSKGQDYTKAYFDEKGYPTCFSYEDFILASE